MIASLPMYRMAHTAAAESRLWAAIRARLCAAGIPAPKALARPAGDLMAHWLSPDLILSQTCGLPYRRALHGRVGLVGTPDYGLPGCRPGHYRSVVVARRDDPRRALDDFAGARLAYNEFGSQSGWAALAAAAPHVVGGPLVHSGAHRASVRAVQTGHADFAAIDEVTWRLLAAAGATAGLKVVHATEPTPGLPLITAAGNDTNAIFHAVHAAIGGLEPPDRATLGLRGLVQIPARAYLAVADPPDR